jgi:CTP:molybdopterin cytidylyltransferase MocA
LNQPALNQLGAVLLAAGGSHRLGQSKQLLEIEGQALVRRQAELLLQQGFATVVVVTGADQKNVQEALRGLAVQRVHNDRWQDGMGRSLALGIAAMPERVRGALLLLCDQWKITTKDLQALVHAWQLLPARAITAQWAEEDSQAPSNSDAQVVMTSGPPVIFPRVLFSRLVKLRGDSGAQHLLRNHKAGVARVLLPHAAFDIDLPSDLPSDFSSD